MTSRQSKVVVVNTMVASALVNARLDSSGAEPFREFISGRPIIVSFATVTELHFGAVKAHWGEFRLRSLDRDLEGFTVVRPDDALMQRCARPRFACEQLGHPLAQKLHEADRWIATTAIVGELDLVSNDKVFRGTDADTLHKLVHEHTKDGGLPGIKWDLPECSVVIIDEAAMVDTRLLHQ